MSGPYVSGSTQPLEITCPHCGQPSARGMRFCNRCGNPLAGASAALPGVYPPQQPQQSQSYYPPSTPQQTPYHQPEHPSYQPHQATYGMPPPVAQTPYPAYSQPGAMVATRPGKSLALGLLLALFLGPVGLFYSTVAGGIVMLLLSVGAWVLFFTLVIGRMDYYDPGVTSSGISWITLLALGIWIAVVLISVIWAIVAINSYNSKVQPGQVH